MRKVLLLVACLCAGWAAPAAAQRGDDALPSLTGPVNDFAGVIPADRAESMDRTIRALQAASGDVVVVATIDTFQPYADIREYAVKMFENGGRGIGQKGKDNGVLILLAVRDRQVWVEVGYDVEQFVTDGFAGETSRQYMVPAFRRGDYGTGLEAGLQRIVQRIADGRQVKLEGVPRPQARRSDPDSLTGGQALLFGIFALFALLNMLGRVSRFGGRRRRYRGGSGWSGWNSGVGPFGGGFGGGSWGGGGGFGGGFGGFGGGRSGGGGGGASW